MITFDNASKHSIQMLDFGSSSPKLSIPRLPVDSFSSSAPSAKHCRGNFALDNDLSCRQVALSSRCNLRFCRCCVGKDLIIAAASLDRRFHLFFHLLLLVFYLFFHLLLLVFYLFFHLLLLVQPRFFMSFSLLIVVQRPEEFWFWSPNVSWITFLEAATVRCAAFVAGQLMRCVASISINCATKTIASD